MKREMAFVVLLLSGLPSIISADDGGGRLVPDDPDYLTAGHLDVFTKVIRRAGEKAKH